MYVCYYTRQIAVCSAITFYKHMGEWTVKKQQPIARHVLFLKCKKNSKHKKEEKHPPPYFSASSFSTVKAFGYVLLKYSTYSSTVSTSTVTVVTPAVSSKE